MSNKNTQKAQNKNTTAKEETIVKPKAVFDSQVQVDLLISLLNKDHGDGVKSEVVIDNYIALMFMQYEMTSELFEQFKDMLKEKSSIILEKSFADYVVAAKELTDAEVASADQINEFLGMETEESKIFNFRNGVVGGAVLGAASTLLIKGVNAGGLVGAGVSVVGSWFIAGAVEQKVNAVTDNQYARTVGGVMLGAGIGSLGTLGGSFAQGLIGNASEEKEVVGQELDSPLNELSW